MLSVSEYSALRAGIFKASESFEFHAPDHRLDEPARLSLSMVAPPQSPLPFPLAEPLYSESHAAFCGSGRLAVQMALYCR